MELVVASHPSAIDHDTSRNHPERPERVGAVFAGFRESPLSVVEMVSPPIDRSDLERVHDPTYVEMVEAFCSMGGGALDMDTIVSSESWNAALTAAGGVAALVEELESRGDATGFALTRPPGHHALRDRAMGFCLFNNVAVAAAILRERKQRVVILDWDVHHGNGTEALLGGDPEVLYVSLHQSPFYPFAGSTDAIERGLAPGTVVNIPLPGNTAGDVYREAWGEIVIPSLQQFAPDWVLVSAGYDAHHLDPLADLRLVADDFGWMTDKLRSVHSPNRTVFALEGGYDLDALRESARATVDGMSGGFDAGPPYSSPVSSKRILEPIKEMVGEYFDLD